MKSPAPFWRPVLFLAAGLLLLFACTNQSLWDELHTTIADEHPSVLHLSTDSLSTWLDDPTLPEPLLLDTRSEEEYLVSHIYGAYRVDPADTTIAFLENVSYSTPIVTYCSVGLRSAAVAERLVDQGFSRVYNLEGSLFQWANEGRPLFRDDEETSHVHPGNERWSRLLLRELHAYEPE